MDNSAFYDQFAIAQVGGVPDGEGGACGWEGLFTAELRAQLTSSPVQGRKLQLRMVPGGGDTAE